MPNKSPPTTSNTTTLVTWWTTRRHNGITEQALSKVHALKEVVPSTGSRTRDELQLVGHITKCGRTVPQWQEAKIVKSTLKRPCAQCFNKEYSMPKVNFTKVEDFAPRPASNVEAVLLTHENVTTGAGNPGVKVTWYEAENENRKIFKTYALTPKALWSFKRDMIRMGTPVATMNSEEVDTDEVLEALYGSACTLEFGDPRPYTDKEGNPKLGDNLIGVVDPTA